MLIHEINQLLTATTLSVGGCRREADTRRAVVGLSRVDSLTTLTLQRCSQDVQRLAVLCQHKQKQNLKSHTCAKLGFSERCRGKKNEAKC